MQKFPTLTVEDFSSSSMTKTNQDIYVTVSREGSQDSETIIDKRQILPSDRNVEYSGEVVNGEMHGDGMLTGEAGTYVGEFKNGQADGSGTYYFKYGAKYEGDWKKNLRHGFGVLTLPGGYPKYEGEWRNDEICGNGKMLRSDGGIVEGIFDGNLNGIGTITYPDGNRYQGQFRHGERHGMGILTTPENEKFVGEFQGLTPWEGVMTDAEGREYKLEEGTPIAEVLKDTGGMVALTDADFGYQRAAVQ